MARGVPIKKRKQKRKRGSSILKRDEVRDILSILKLNYPQSFKGWDKQQSIDFINLWAEAFKDDPTELVVGAVKSIIYNDPREFAPNIGQIKQKMYQLTQDEPTEQEAWQRVKKAISNSIYNSTEEFNKFPPLLQKMVGDSSQLREWAVMDVDELNTVVASNFMRSYKVRAQKHKELEMLPNSVKQMINSVEIKQISDNHESDEKEENE